MDNLNRFKDDSERNTQNYTTTMEKYKSMFENLRKMSCDFSNKSEQIRNENREREEYLRRYAQSLEDFNQSKIYISKCEEEIDILSSNINKIQGEISEFNGQKISFQQKLPFLEKEKKDFAANRNFKVNLY